QDPRPKTQDPRPKTQDPRPKTQDPRPKTQDPLFSNLAKDPSETKDLAESEGERVAAMKTKLETWMKSVLASLRGEDY
ncbi:MAG: hypothetical protein ACI8UO_002729, partial [Verrucomicrobiales bacterium]